MIKLIGVIASGAGGIMLIIGFGGILGVFQTVLSPWAFSILGVFFFFAGMYLLKHGNGSDDIPAGK